MTSSQFIVVSLLCGDLKGILLLILFVPLPRGHALFDRTSHREKDARRCLGVAGNPCKIFVFHVLYYHILAFELFCDHLTSFLFYIDYGMKIYFTG
mmetsp:Transcript_23554/g.49320  ORF Transcript_23554/g.49320 Transcript_23554/m.49320 type:complete len:96 (-) Transcript_23554:28-315(-)